MMFTWCLQFYKWTKWITYQISIVKAYIKFTFYIQLLCTEINSRIYTIKTFCKYLPFKLFWRLFCFNHKYMHTQISKSCLKYTFSDIQYFLKHLRFTRNPYCSHKVYVIIFNWIIIFLRYNTIQKYYSLIFH